MATKGKSTPRSGSRTGVPTPGPSTHVPPPQTPQEEQQPEESLSFPLDPVFGESYTGPADGEPAEGQHLWGILQLINRKLDALARTIEIMENVSVEQGSAISNIKTTLANLPSTPTGTHKADPDPTPRVPRVRAPSVSFHLGSPICGRSPSPKRLSASPSSRAAPITSGTTPAPQTIPPILAVPTPSLTPGPTSGATIKIPPLEKFKGDGDQKAKTWMMEATVWFHMTASQFGNNFDTQMLYLLSCRNRPRNPRFILDFLEFTQTQTDKFFNHVI